MTRQFWCNAFSFGRRLAWLWLLIGMFVAWATINLSQPPGVIVTSEVEAEGPQFSDVNTLDMVLHIRRNRACPSSTQRWVWRWTDYRGRRVPQVIPLPSTVGPFLASTDEMILTLPVPGVPDPVNGNWFFRSVTTENCSFLPNWAGTLLGARMFRSPDVPVNFVGAPHDG